MFCFSSRRRRRRRGKKGSNMLKQILNKFSPISSNSDPPDSTHINSIIKQLPTTSYNQSDQGTSIPGRSNKNQNRSGSSSNEPLIPFKDVPETERMNLFVSKVSLCCVRFDFDDPRKNQLEKDVKRQTLLELLDFVSLSGSMRFSEAAILAMCRMCGVNLFRVFPPNYRSHGKSCGTENDEEELMFDPSWPHLEIVYELLLKFIVSPSLDAKVAKKYIDHTFILQLLDLFDTHDPRERECLKNILHRVYGKFMVYRPFIRKSISNIFYGFAFEAEKHNGIAELLEVLGSVITGFALPLKEEHKNLLLKVLIPLHKPKSLGVYFQQLSYCVVQFIEKEGKLGSFVIKKLLKIWPITSSQKEVMFLTEIEEILETINMVEFRKVMAPLFYKIGACINSSHFQVAEKALYLWNNDQVINLIARNIKVVLPIIFPSIENNVKNHWNQAVQHQSLVVKIKLANMDEHLFLLCHSRYKEKEKEKILSPKENKKQSRKAGNLATENNVVKITRLATSITC